MPISLGGTGSTTASAATTALGLGTTDTPQFLGLDLESTDAGAGEAPSIDLYRNSVSPANNDNIGHIEFRGNKSNVLGSVSYGKISTKILEANATLNLKSQMMFSILGLNGYQWGMQTIHDTGIDMIGDITIKAISPCLLYTSPSPRD